MYSSLSLALWLFAYARAQSSVSVPADLSSKFDPSSISLQVNYNNEAEFGFQDGTQFTSQQTSRTPDFALGDASGINTAISFLLIMLDTTTKDRVLHFLQPDFKSNGDETQIASSTKPILTYTGPGTLGETGSRQYSFLLYQQVGTFKAKSIPSAGQTIDVQKFQSDNGLDDALAGVVMVVDLASTAPSSAQQQSTASIIPFSTPPSITSLTSAPVIVTSTIVSPQTTPAAVSIVISLTETSISSIAIQSTLAAISNFSQIALPSFTSSTAVDLTSETYISMSSATTVFLSTLASSSSTSSTPTVAASRSSAGSSTYVRSAALISFFIISACVALS